MDIAIARVKHALEAGERIAVFGDYDVDGSVSAALVREFPYRIGIAAAPLYPRPHDGGLWPLGARDAGA